MRTAVDVTLDGEPDRAELVAMAGEDRLLLLGGQGGLPFQQLK